MVTLHLQNIQGRRLDRGLAFPTLSRTFKRLTREMRYPVYSHSVDPLRSAPICRKSRTYVNDLIANGKADWLSAVDESRGIQLRDPDKVETDKHLDSRQTAASLTDEDCVQNATGAADKGKRDLSAKEIIAMSKVRHFGRASWADRVRVVEA